MTTRAQFREAIGRQLGRSYYDKSTTHASVACTTTQVYDAKRTEDEDYWNGAALLVAGVERVVTTGTPHQRGATPSLYLDRALTGAPGLGVNYEVLKGWTFADMHEAIDRAHTLSYPYLYDTDTVLVNETNDVENLVATAAGNWRNIAEVNRKGVGATRYVGLRQNYDYKFRVDQGQWLYLPQYTTEVGAQLQFIADVPLSFAPGDDTTASVANLDLIVAGATWWLYEKGANPDEASLQDRWQREADKAATRFEMLKRQFAMQYRGNNKVIRPAVHVVNTGYLGSELT